MKPEMTTAVVGAILCAAAGLFVLLRGGSGRDARRGQMKKRVSTRTIKRFGGSRASQRSIRSPQSSHDHDADDAFSPSRLETVEEGMSMAQCPASGARAHDGRPKAVGRGAGPAAARNIFGSESAMSDERAAEKEAAARAKAEAEAAARAKAEAEAAARAKAEQEAAAKAKAEQEAADKRRAEEEAAARAKAEADAAARAKAEAAAKAEQEAAARAKAEAEVAARAKAEAEAAARAKAEQEAADKRRAEEEAAAKAKAEQEAADKRRAEEEAAARARAEQEAAARAKAEVEARAKAEQEAADKRRAEEEAAAKAEQEAADKRRAEEEAAARAKAEQEAADKRRAEEEAAAKADQEAAAKRRAEQEAADKRRAEEEAAARAKAEQEAAAKAQQEPGADAAAKEAPAANGHADKTADADADAKAAANELVRAAEERVSVAQGTAEASVSGSGTSDDAWSRRRPKPAPQGPAAAPQPLQGKERLLVADGVVEVLKHDAEPTQLDKDTFKTWETAFNLSSRQEFSKAEKLLFQAVETHRNNPGQIRARTMVFVYRSLGEMLNVTGRFDASRLALEAALGCADQMTAEGVEVGRATKTRLLDVMGRILVGRPDPDVDGAVACMEEALAGFASMPRLAHEGDATRARLIDVVAQLRSQEDALRLLDEQLASLDAEAERVSKAYEEVKGEGEAKGAEGDKQGAEEDEDEDGEAEKAEEAGEGGEGGAEGGGEEKVDLAYESLPEAQRLHRLTRVHRNSALALRFKRAGLLEAMGRKDDAVDAMRKAVDEMASLHPTATERINSARAGLAQILFHRGSEADVEEGLKIHREIVEEAEKAGAEGETVVANALLRLGIMQMQHGRVEDAYHSVKRGVTMFEGMLTGQSRAGLEQPYRILIDICKKLGGREQEEQEYNRKMLKLRMPIGERRQQSLKRQESLGLKRQESGSARGLSRQASTAGGISRQGSLARQPTTKQ